MGKAFKCDMTGQLQDGEGITSVDVKVSETLVLRVTPFAVLDKQRMVQGTISKESAAKIEAAISELKGKK